MDSAAETDSPVGTRFGKYQLLKKLASGGMGEVFLAKQVGPVGFEKVSVIKRILAKHLDKQSYVDMFFSEARLAALLNQSNIVQIYDMGEEQDHLYIAMEYVHGRSLRDVIDVAIKSHRPIPLAHIIEILIQVCAGMSYAHNLKDLGGNPLNIVHRDINPQNLLVSYNGEVKIIDFGIAKSSVNTHKTETGTIKGKYVYMSPEQSAAEPLDSRSDIFALGIVMYEMCTGTNPFHHTNIVMSLEAIQRKDPPRVEQVRPDVKLIGPIVHRALMKEREDRFADCSEIKEALLELQQSGKVERAPQPLGEYMAALFSSQINEDKQVLLETHSGARNSGKHPAAPRSTSRVNVPKAPTPPPSRPPTQPSLKAVGTPEPRKGVDPRTYRQKVPVAPADDGEDLFPDADPTELEGDARVAQAVARPNTAAAATSDRAGGRNRLVWGLTAAVLFMTLLLGGAVAYLRSAQQPATPAPTTPTPAPAAATTPAPTTPTPAPTAAPGPDETRAETAEPDDTGEEEHAQPKGHGRQKKKESNKTSDAHGVGKLTVNAGQGVSVTLGGKRASGAAAFALLSNTGQMKLSGSGVDVTIRYAVKNNAIYFNVESEPWTIVQVNGVSLGKTPQSDIGKGESRLRVVLKNPKVEPPMTIALLFRSGDE